MGFTDVGFMKYSLVADHYQHIAIIGVIALAAAGWSIWRRSMREEIALGGDCSGRCRGWIARISDLAQSGIYRDAITLVPGTLEKNPDCWMAHNNLGVTLVESGRLQEAIEHYEQALR